MTRVETGPNVTRVETGLNLTRVETGLNLTRVETGLNLTRIGHVYPHLPRIPPMRLQWFLNDRATI